MKIIILGVDGYLGWPTAMYLSARGHEVIGADNYFRRMAAMELDCEALIPSPNLEERARIWQQSSGEQIEISVGDITDYRFLSELFERHQPDAVIHYAEQPSAPYSMIDRDKGAFTIQNNLIGTYNVIYAVREHAPDCHIVKLGTMGEYGTPDIDIEEGWLEIEHKGRKDKFLFPRQAGSLYHTTKIQDTDLLWFYARVWGIRVTDLMQGPVYGLDTEESARDERLSPNFHYDEIFGTVLNRFVVQAVIGHPLTVYGKGGQIRGYLNLKDTMACIDLSLSKPPERGELRIFNQFTETFSVNDLAAKVKQVGDEKGLAVRIEALENPRKEREEHYYNPTHTGLIELGLTPHLLTEEVLSGMFDRVSAHRERVNRRAIFRGVKWS